MLIFFPDYLRVIINNNVFQFLQFIPPDETWNLLPYLWFAFHWLAMSHSCYNPIIYCYMNARFRSGFIQVLHRIPGFRRCFCLKKLRGTHKHLGESMMGATGFALTGENKFQKAHPNCKQICYTKPTHNVTKCNNNEEDDLDEEDDVVHGTGTGTELSHFRCPPLFSNNCFSV